MKIETSLLHSALYYKPCNLIHILELLLSSDLIIERRSCGKKLFVDLGVVTRLCGCRFSVVTK